MIGGRSAEAISAPRSLRGGPDSRRRARRAEGAGTRRPRPRRSCPRRSRPRRPSGSRGRTCRRRGGAPGGTGTARCRADARCRGGAGTGGRAAAAAAGYAGGVPTAGVYDDWNLAPAGQRAGRVRAAGRRPVGLVAGVCVHDVDADLRQTAGIGLVDELLRLKHLLAGEAHGRVVIQGDRQDLLQRQRPHGCHRGDGRQQGGPGLPGVGATSGAAAGAIKGSRGGCDRRRCRGNSGNQVRRLRHQWRAPRSASRPAARPTVLRRLRVCPSFQEAASSALMSL